MQRLNLPDDDASNKIIDDITKIHFKTKKINENLVLSQFVVRNKRFSKILNVIFLWSKLFGRNVFHSVK